MYLVVLDLNFAPCLPLIVAGDAADRIAVISGRRIRLRVRMYTFVCMYVCMYYVNMISVHVCMYVCMNTCSLYWLSFTTEYIA